MMELKFRAWIKSKGKMELVTRIKFRGERPTAIWTKGQQYAIEPLSDFVLMQFTGLKDRNEIEIYNGDIVESEISEKTGAVSWKNDDGRWTVGESEETDGDYLSPIYKYKVIGNVFENKDLLK